MLYLVDTSVWINIFSKKPTFVIDETSLPKVALCPPIIQEILQGIREEPIFYKMKNHLLSFPIYEESLSLDFYTEASSLFRLARSKGYTIRSSVDCLIAAIAIAHNLTIWHNDRDFDSLAKISSLQVFKGKYI